MVNGEPTPPQLEPDQGRQRGERALLILGGVAVGVVCLALIAVVFVVLRPSTPGDFQAVVGEEPAVEELPRVEEPVDETTAIGNVGADDEPAISNDGRSIDSPFAMNAETTLRLAEFGEPNDPWWNVTVGEIRDITADVRAANLSLDPPADGVVFAGFDAEMTLVSADEVPLSQGFNSFWEIVGGATGEVFGPFTLDTTGSSGCLDFPMAWSEFDEVFTGGTVSGTVCIPIPIEDLEHPATIVRMDFRSGDSRDRVFFAPEGSSPEPIASPAPDDVFFDAEDNDPRKSPFGYDSPLALELDIPGDVEGSGWTLTIGRPADITQAVLANDASQFPDSAPDGVVFAGFDVSQQLKSSQVQLLSAGVFSFEIAGGATGAIYNESTVRSRGCGFVRVRLDAFAGISPGGINEGTVCIPIPAEDLGDRNTVVSLRLRDGTRLYFGDN